MTRGKLVQDIKDSINVKVENGSIIVDRAFNDKKQRLTMVFTEV